jgi:hypothetical protein
LILSILLHLRVFYAFKGAGTGNIWLPILLSHVVILPGIFGWLIVFLLGGVTPFSGAMGTYYVLGFIVALVASFWLPRTKPFAVLNMVGNHSRDFALMGLIFFPVFMSVVAAYIGFITSNI